MAIREKNGSWCVYWNKDGKREEKYFGSGPVNKIKAERFNEKIGYGKRESSDPGAVIFIQFIEDYLRHLQARTKNEANVNNTIWKLSGVILPFFGAKDVYSLIHADLDEYIIHRKSQTTRLGTPPKQVTINREIDEIQSYLNWCVINRKILNNPLSGYRRPGDDREVIQPPSVAEINKIIEHSATHLIRFILLSFYIGSRPGPIETGALKWEHIDWDEKQIIVRSADKKGLNSRRIDLHEGLIPFLKEWRLEDENSGYHSGYIVHLKGNAIKSIKKAFSAAKRRAGITRRIRPYDIRHAHVTQQLDHGADLKAVSKNVGHKSPDTTIKVYQHVSVKLQKEAIELLPTLEIKKKDSHISHISDFLKKKSK